MKSLTSKFIFRESYKNEVKSMLGNEGDIDAAIAFVGSGANLWFSNKRSKYRLIINLSSGGTNPEEIIKIQKKRKNCIIKQLDDLHAKVIISNRTTIIGSANLSANGLGLEGREIANWEEAGIITLTSDDKRQWFNYLWEKSKEISKDDLKKAKETWDRRKTSRPLINKKSSLDFLKDRDIALVVSWEIIEKKERKAADEKFKKEKINKGLKPDKHVYAYQNFDFDKKTIYFDYWLSNQGKGALVCSGITRLMTPRRKYGDIEYLLHDDKIVHHGIRLKDYQRRITGLLKAHLKTFKLQKYDGGTIIKLNDILK